MLSRPGNGEESVFEKCQFAVRRAEQAAARVRVGEMDGMAAEIAANGATENRTEFIFALHGLLPGDGTRQHVLDNSFRENETHAAGLAAGIVFGIDLPASARSIYIADHFAERTGIQTEYRIQSMQDARGRYFLGQVVLPGVLEFVETPRGQHELSETDIVLKQIERFTGCVGPMLTDVLCSKYFPAIIYEKDIAARGGSAMEIQENLRKLQTAKNLYHQTVGFCPDVTTPAIHI